jgi:hypothetical protein
MWRPVVPAAVAAGIVLVVVARAWDPQTLVQLVPVGVLWVAVAGALMWRFGLAPRERDQFRRELWRGGATAVEI